MKKIFITGGSGALGRALVNYLKGSVAKYPEIPFEILDPSSKECNILDLNDLQNTISNFSPDIVVHLAAFVDTLGCENDTKKAMDTNIIGTINIVKALSNLNCKLVYVSSEYVFKGDKGNYSIDDRLDPINVYGKTKASAEYVASIFDNHQIIRVPFIKKVYPKVFENQYCSRYFLDEVPEKIVANMLYNSSKIVHISSYKSTLYGKYQNRNYDTIPIKIPKEYEKIIPKDTSLINNSI